MSENKKVYYTNGIEVHTRDEWKEINGSTSFFDSLFFHHYG